MSIREIRNTLRRRSAATAALAVIAVALNPHAALAIDAQAPITATNGIVGCATCATESNPVQYNIPVWGSTQEFGTIAPTSQTTYFLRSKGTSANPAFEAIAIGDIPSGTNTQWAALIGSPTGSGEFVRATNPSLAGVTITGAVSASGATAPFTLPAGAIGSISDIASGIKIGSGSKLATFTGALPGAARCVRINATNDLEATSADCATGTSSPNPVMSLTTTTPVTVLSSTAVYLSLSGEVSTTEANVRTPFKNATTLGSLMCTANANTTNQITAAIGTGACTSAASFSGASVTMSATANTQGTSTGTTAISAGQCAVIKLTAGTDAAAASIHCTFERTA